ncbi:unnamed protein product [Moneuplotes crassus]|uniref:Cyclic nucleotide-binding domain-containing protein n=1 Tax=Euplotes crassus TaxID=5936 RepID=A0AAD1Y5H5_EUPCR|nr:unnamed protein product [Moneuplotes crassus]
MFLQRIGAKTVKMMYESLRQLTFSKKALKKNKMLEYCSKKIKYKEGALIDGYIILKGHLCLSTMKKGYIPKEGEPEDYPEYFVKQNEFICSDNIWKYIPNFGKNIIIRYLQFVPEDEQLEVLKLPMSEYKHIVKRNPSERDVMIFLSKAIPSLGSYCLSTKMKVVDNFTPKYYKGGEIICKEGDELGHIMVILQGECEILKNNPEAKTYRGESGLGFLSESLINNKIWTVSSNHWIGGESVFYNKPLAYSVRSLSIVRLLICSREKINSIPKDILESLKKELDRSISLNEDRLQKLEDTKKMLLNLDHEISRTLPEQISHLTKKYPNASKNTISNIRKVLLPELMNKPRFLLCKNTARVDPTLHDDNSKKKIISQFLEKKRQGQLDDPGNTFQSFMHLTLAEEGEKPRYLYESTFDEKHQKAPPDITLKHTLCHRSNSITQPREPVSMKANIRSINNIKLRNKARESGFTPSEQGNYQDPISEEVKKYSQYKKMQEESRRNYETIDSLSPKLRNKYARHSSIKLLARRGSNANKMPSVERDSSVKTIKNSYMSFEQAFEDRVKNMSERKSMVKNYIKSSFTKNSQNSINFSNISLNRKSIKPFDISKSSDVTNDILRGSRNRSKPSPKRMPQAALFDKGTNFYFKVKNFKRKKREIF